MLPLRCVVALRFRKAWQSRDRFSWTVTRLDREWRSTQNRSTKKQLSIALLSRKAVWIADDAKAGQILIFSAGVDALGDRDLNVTFVHVGERSVLPRMQRLKSSRLRRF